jgi:predicted HTH transcriptional regulator
MKPAARPAKVYHADGDYVPYRHGQKILIQYENQNMPEHQNIEWKREWKDDWLAQLCGFANADGGTLWIGIDDAGRVRGVEQVEHIEAWG